MPDKATDISLTVGGTALSRTFLGHLHGLTLEESLTEMAELQFTLVDGHSLNLTDLPQKLVGQPVTLAMGWRGELQGVFEGDVVGVAPQFEATAPATLTVTCHDRGHKLRRIDWPTIYRNPSHKRIITEIARRHEMQLLIEPADKLGSFQLQDDQSVVQVDETDWQIVALIAKKGNYNLLVHADTIYLVDDAFMATAAFHEALRPGSSRREFRFVYRMRDEDVSDPNAWPLRSFNPELGTQGQRTKVEVKTWAAVGAEGQTYGKSNLKSIPTAGKKYTEVTVKTETIETLRIVGEAAENDAQARYLAQAEMAQRAARLVKGEVTIDLGVPHLHVGMEVLIDANGMKQFGDMFSGPHLIEAIRLEIDGTGMFRTAFDVRRDGVTEE